MKVLREICKNSVMKMDLFRKVNFRKFWGIQKHLFKLSLQYKNMWFIKQTKNVLKQTFDRSNKPKFFKQIFDPSIKQFFYYLIVQQQIVIQTNVWFIKQSVNFSNKYQTNTKFSKQFFDSSKKQTIFANFDPRNIQCI